jgi:Abortive infection C-terminus
VRLDRDKPLHSLVGEYIKFLKQHRRIQSEMTERILKSSISVMEAFNTVRNEQSLAHDNPVLLSHNEALLIFNNVASAIRFITALEHSDS